MAEQFEARIGGEVLDQIGVCLDLVEAALDYRDHRLIGEVPQVLQVLCGIVAAQLWAEWRESWSRVRVHMPQGERAEYSQAELAADDRAIELASQEYRAAGVPLTRWEQSLEGKAASETRHRRSAFVSARSAETRALRAEWLEQEARDFSERRTVWEKKRHAELMAAYETAEAAATWENFARRAELS